MRLWDTMCGTMTADRARHGAMMAVMRCDHPDVVEFVRAKDDLELYYKTIPDYFEQDDGRKLTEVPDRTSTDMIEGTY